MQAFDSAVRAIQFLSADGVQKAGSGHPGTPMALAGITADIYSRYLRYNPKDPAWPNRDRFVLSCGHASMLLYSILHLAGYDLPKSELERFRQWESLTPGHPEFRHTAGVETTTGPLGQGVANSVGLALASKICGARVNRPGSTLIDYRVFALASDGDLMEGVASEACSLAGQWGLGNLVVVYDANNITIDGKAELAFSENVKQRFEAYGWGVWNADGHDPAQVRAALDAAVADTARPSLVIAKTHIAIGCPNLQDTSKAHGSPLGDAEIRLAKEAAGWPVEPAFHVPDAAYEPFKARVAEVKSAYDAWQAQIAKLSGDQKAEWDAINTGAPTDVLAQLTSAVEPKKEATRVSGSKVGQHAAKLVPSLTSGSADLNSSTKTDIVGAPFVSNGEYAARNVRYGVREHAMGAIANGLALGGLTPVTSTFLIFSDYMRPPIRLASMMGIQSIYVFTHDSFYVGEDGPTHQPVEQTSSLRLIPNLDVVRPADGLECGFAWAHALQRKEAPTALLLTRQDLPALERPSGFDVSQMAQGAYVVREAADPTLVIIATGSEVSLAVAAAPLLEQSGQRVRVVSAPCLELFARQPKSVQEAVLGSARRVSIEAGATGLWRQWIGLDGIAIGLDHYGASAPAETVAAKFGFTPEGVAKSVLAQL